MTTRYSDSKVQAYLRQHPETRDVFARIITRSATGFSGDELVDGHINPMIARIYADIRAAVRPHELTPLACLHFINELSVFARFNSQFLNRAAHSLHGYVPELAHELRRNFLEEGGNRGAIPAHYVLYSSALLQDLDIMINGYVPCASTQMLVFLHHVLVDSHCPSTICGAYYATEGVAIDETRLLQEITDQYGRLTRGRTGKELSHLSYYYALHLDEEHEGATGGVAVEAGHMEGIAGFIRHYRRYNLELPQICDGFLQIFEAMVAWWYDLSENAKLCEQQGSNPQVSGLPATTA